jgi:hypothetical protein
MLGLMQVRNEGWPKGIVFYPGPYESCPRFTQGECFDFFMYFITSSAAMDVTVSEDAGIEPRTVATLALAVRLCYHSAMYLIHTPLDLVHTRLDLIHKRLYLIQVYKRQATGKN